MLKKLTVSNFAVIEFQALDFCEGLNVLTGETGAGKSILIEALGFLLGARSSVSWIRAGAQKLEVEGVFEDGGKTLRLRRELDASGKTKAFVDGQSAPVSALQERGESWVDFHGQHDHQTLMRAASQRALLDRFGGHEGELSAVRRLYGEWSAFQTELASLSMPEEERRRRAELARFQVEEIDAAKLKLGEEETLEAELPRLKNGERLRALACGAYETLYEQEGAALAGLLKAERALGDLSRLDPALSSARERLEAARAAVDDVAHELGAYRERVGADPARVDAALSRLETISRLKRKHGGSVADILESRERLARELSALEGSAERGAELEAKLTRARERLEASCEALHKARAKAAKKLELRAVKELRELGMPEARFAVSLEIEEGRLTKEGMDEVSFLLAANPGEPPRPLKAVASGGELSRVMLALKTVLAQADRVPILVFDEVDAGVGGVVARAVGERLALLGKTRQVLCVTHLPQVACYGRAHFLVAKSAAQGRTRVAVERLEGERRLEAVAQMLGGMKATPASRKHAKELLESSAS